VKTKRQARPKTKNHKVTKKLHTSAFNERTSALEVLNLEAMLQEKVISGFCFCTREKQASPTC
jgi:hypothetical protein